MTDRKAYQREWTQKNLARVRACQRAWYWRNRDQVRHKEKETRPERTGAIRDSKLKTRYGITSEQWTKIFESQDKRCAICETNEPGSQGWHTDHDHATGIVRGILCFNCNIGLGKFKEHSDLLLRAAAYLDKDRR